MKILRSVLFLQLLGCAGLFAQADPYSGYTNTDSFFLPYSSGSFSSTNNGDVFVNFSLPGSTGTTTNFNVQVDTGSRGFYASSTALGANFTNAASFSGQINLSSSGRVFQGYWTPTSMTFGVTNLATGLNDTVTSSVTVLDVQSLTCDSNHPSTTFTTTTATGTIIADIIGTTNTTILSYSGHSVTVAQGYSVSFAKNTNLANESNFGVGFYLGGATNSTTTGPIGNNQNQTFNPLINLTDPKLVAGYIIKTNGIQLGLATNVSGYAYTKLNSTGLASTNSVPDWQASMGTVVNGGVTNKPGNIIFDSGVGNAYFSAAGLTNASNIISNNITVQLVNSGGAANGGVGYHIDLSSTNALNPTTVDFSISGTNGIFSQNQDPYGESYFNTGRNAFDAFNMLYDAKNGYLGFLTNDYGSLLANNGSGIVTFNAQAGGFPNPIPEPSTYALLALSALALLVAYRRRA